MKFTRKFTVTLTPEEVQTIIANYMSKELEVKLDSKNITFNVNTQLEGYGPMEHPVTKFRGCSIRYQGDTE